MASHNDEQFWAVRKHVLKQSCRSILGIWTFAHAPWSSCSQVLVSKQSSVFESTSDRSHDSIESSLFAFSMGGAPGFEMQEAPETAPNFSLQSLKRRFATSGHRLLQPVTVEIMNV